jgi:hypothetical protein
MGIPGGRIRQPRQLVESFLRPKGRPKLSPTPGQGTAVLIRFRSSILAFSVGGTLQPLSPVHGRHHVGQGPRIRTIHQVFFSKGTPVAAIKYISFLRVAREVFLKNSSHLLTPVDRTLLEETSTTFQQLLEDEIPAVYLTCEESVMLDRLKERGRASEGNMT